MENVLWPGPGPEAEIEEEEGRVAGAGGTEAEVCGDTDIPREFEVELCPHPPECVTAAEPLLVPR